MALQLTIHSCPLSNRVTIWHQTQAFQAGDGGCGSQLNADPLGGTETPMLTEISLRRSVWLVAFALVVHELEEWNIAPWFTEHFENAPGIQRPAVWLGLAVVSAVAVLWAWAATRAKSDMVCGVVALPLLAGAAGNALEHLVWFGLFGAYAPGVVTAAFLVLPATLLFLVKIPKTTPLLVAYAGLGLLLLFGARATYLAGSHLQDHQVALQTQFILLAQKLGF